jgi:uncharacterized protein YdeI (YjbR/CyaY-like superfamily)
VTPVFFRSAAEWRRWLEQHHATSTECLVGFYKVGTQRPTLTWPQSVDEALCFGWIDGVRRSLGEESYTIRFTPRRPTSTWSAVNIRRFAELARAGLTRPAGHRAAERRTEARSRRYAYEQRAEARLELAAERKFRARPEAWKFFLSQPPSYRKVATYWVVSAKREETRERRLATLIRDSAAGRRIGPLRPQGAAVRE